MAENETNGTAPTSDGGQPQQQLTGHLQINAQYAKDLSFENPRAPQSLQQQTQPEVQINVDVQARSLGGPDMYEVVLQISANAKIQNEPVFVVELTYAAVVTARSENQELLALLILVETPRLLFPFAREIVAAAVRDGGFPPLLINPIDFAELLRRRQAQGGQATATA
jgi:preprotein translocase subunit SecB